ncbi:MAG TPA: hydroxyisourate hydrolase [Streptosporangiaceae bacterium]
MSTVTTHVLDTALGQPAAGMAVRLESATGMAVASGVTGTDGRIGALGPDGLSPGVYRIVFGTGAYFARDGRRSFYPEVTVTFTVEDGGGHCHVPLTLSPFAYSTYRGS